VSCCGWLWFGIRAAKQRQALLSLALGTAGSVREAVRHAPLNGKVQHSNLTDQLEFYQLLEYADDVDLREKCAWEEFKNTYRPNTSLSGLTPYEVLRSKSVW